MVLKVLNAAQVSIFTGAVGEGERCRGLAIPDDDGREAVLDPSIC